jgi:glycosyltransferase involved in cell wall biosynthesis
LSLRVGVPLFGTDAGRSGLSVYARSLLQALLEADPSLELELIGPAEDLDPVAPHEPARVRARRTAPWTRTRAGDWWWHRRELPRWARARAVDLVFYPAGNRRLRSLGEVPTVATVHDLGELAIPEKYGRLRRWRVQHEILPAMRQVSGLITISPASQQAIVEATGLSRVQVPVVANGVAQSFRPGDPQADRAALRRDYGLERPFFLYVARLEHPAMNHVGLLRAFAREGLAATHDLVLIGADWPGCEVVYRTVEELGLEGVVKRPGFVPDADLPGFYRAATALAFVSRFEGFGLPVVEAMASGCPLLVSDVEPMRGLAGEAGLRVDPESDASIGSGLRALADDAALRARLRERGLLRARHFTWEQAARETLAVFRQVLAARRPARAA